MANTYTTLNDLFTAIANSIRNKKNSTETIVADTFPTEIDNLRIGFDYNNLEVTSISDYAFYGWKDLNSVDCYNLTSIGVSAFENCTNLKSVILYEGVTTIDENAFKGCDNVIIYYKGSSIPETWHDNWNPDNRPVLFGEPIETWDVSATEADNVVAKLYGINDEYTLLVDGNGTMKNYTFSGNTVSPWRAYSNITSTIILDSVTSIGNYTFYKCSNLTSITIPDSVINIGSSVFFGCTSLTSITIPDSVTSIGNNAFSGCKSLTFINIPDGVTNIGSYAFLNCTSLISAGPIGGNYNYEFGWTNKIPNYAFSGCSNLTSITLPDSVISIGDYAFAVCESLTSITIPDSVTSIGNNAFYICSNLRSINIPDGVTNIGSYAFSGSNLTSITLPDSVISISNNAFSGCESLASITIPDSVIKIGSSVFYGCTSLISAGPIGGNYNYEFGWTNKIPNYAFSSSSLTSITIPDSVTSIGNNAFYSCSNLRSINIPDGVTNIGSYAFWKCTSLTSIIYTGTITQWQAITFGNSWNDNTPDYTIHCTDGDIAKDGTITYH